jgi:ribosomal-protein-alanine acetyltransferase
MPTEQPTLVIRELSDADIPAVERILAESPEAAQWLGPACRNHSLASISVWVGKQQAKVVGVIAARRVADQGEIVNLAVAPACRRQGLGRRLVEHAMARMEHEGARAIFLEVRESNAGARESYARMGFREAGRRRHYYRDPLEDALVLSRSTK